ncbi:MAG: ATP-grasp domain-containing protein [Treponema sp.]|nr:ATP-grasp domain-containing protein [Treponema sp.]MCL2252712.1 ATP-grasp domain-containing protein [Treponema sp.]
MKETIIILGAGVMQGPAINIAKELNLHTVVLDGSSSAPCISMADQFEQIDLKDKESIEAFARSLLKKNNRLGIMTAGTDFSASAAWTAEKLGLPGIPYETALNASDKSRMRECFKKAKLPSPDFYTITKETQTQFANSVCADSFPLPFPVVIKPTDNMGSRGCRRVDNINDFPQAAKSAINFSRSGRAIVECYMDGPEFSVDAIVYHGKITICGLADRHIFFPPYFIEMGHTMPTVIEKEKQDALLETFCQGIHALGLSEKENIGAAKGDIKLTEKGPMIGEIAARLSGGYMSGWTYPYSSGCLPVRAAILAAMGREPDSLIPNRNWTCAERAFISIPGTVKQIFREEKKGEHVNDFFLRITVGDKVSFPENNVTKCGNIIASAKDRDTAVKAALTAACSVLIRLDASDSQTSAFLKSSEDFPPSAFQLTDDLKTALSKLPETSNQSINNKTLIITPFPEFTSSNLTDYMGRTVLEALEAVRILTGLPLQIEALKPSENAENIVRLGRSFWASLIRGSYQGAVYCIDNLRVNEKIHQT